MANQLRILIRDAAIDDIRYANPPICVKAVSKMKMKNWQKRRSQFIDPNNPDRFKNRIYEPNRAIAVYAFLNIPEVDMRARRLLMAKRDGQRGLAAAA
ncbi:hypothetical protein M2360_002728 [Rhizobium sp. SG_E_25_P2]|uniref:hypothetical protein n=1 Tax=Rhizobium sp. SG_E_25_P2 TaxID=2879942 RepID=UPI002476F65B|nr:hypothetical protein [Rhizobium sp. SG_E_25_P2]MDH6267331.1 hypothetical protein [Rhizobium sp. SG_E_25_P2]